MICIAKPEDACHANERRENVSDVSGLGYSLGEEGGAHQYGSVQARHPGYQV